MARTLTDEEVIAKLTEYLESMDMTVPPEKIRDLVLSANQRSAYTTMAGRARLRPANYPYLTERQQWEIDRELGILDWDGDPTK